MCSWHMVCTLQSLCAFLIALHFWVAYLTPFHHGSLLFAEDKCLSRGDAMPLFMLVSQSASINQTPRQDVL